MREERNFGNISAKRGAAKQNGSYYGHTRWDVIELIPKGTTSLLDVGCGEGETALAAQQTLGIHQIVGIEVNRSAGEIAATKLGKVFIGNVEDIELDVEDKHFDCILCSDVLEHMVNPWAVLRRLRRALSDDGVLIASIPNIGHIVPVLKIVFDRFLYQEEGILDRTHLRFFTLYTIKQMFRDEGFTIVDVKTNRSRSWKFTLLSLLSFGLLNRFSIEQFRLVAKKVR